LRGHPDLIAVRVPQPVFYGAGGQPRRVPWACRAI